MDVVVLSRDPSLFEAIRHAVGERNPVWRARTAEESVELLLCGQCGVLLLDLAAVSTEAATLVEQIVAQFPDVVVLVAGRRDDESLLARLISDGLVYRFMHKPLSPKRAGMFLNAAIRSHVERRDGRLPEPLLPLVGAIRRRFDVLKWLFVTAGVAVFMLLLGLLLVERHKSQRPAAVAAVKAPAPVVRAQPLADPVLSGARAALAAGRYEAPAGRNSLDLFAAVLLARPNHPEARAGLAETTARLVALAAVEAQQGNVGEAQRLLGRVLAVDPGNAPASELRSRIDAPPVAAEQSAPPVAESLPSVAPETSPSVLQPVVPPATAPQPTLSQPSAIVRPRATAAAPRTAPVVRVMPDPLTPRTESPPKPRRSVTSVNRWAGRPYGPPVKTGHPTAGYEVRAPATETVAPHGWSAPIAATEALPDRDLEQVIVVEPVYPPAAFMNRTSGWVEVEFTVSASGEVTDVAVVAAEPYGVFDAAASAAVAGWRYRPRVVNGRPVAQRTSVTLRFDVED